MAAIEMLSTGERVRRPVVGVGNGPEDQIDLVHKLRAPKCEMKPGSGIEHDASAFWICGARVVLGHAEKLRIAPDGAACRGLDSTQSLAYNPRSSHGPGATLTCDLPIMSALTIESYGSEPGGASQTDSNPMISASVS
jgi:hypothetical protein